MPSLGADMVSGTLVEWRVKAGDAVKRGQIIAEVETDKGAIEVEIFEDGVVDALLVAPGTKVPVGTPLATLRGAAAMPPSPAAPPTAAVPPSGPAGGEVGRGRQVRVSPLARKRAAELGIDPSTLRGTGAGGAVTMADVEAAPVPARAPAPPPPPSPPPPPVEADRSAAMRRAIAAAMSRSKREIPHYYLATDVDVSRLVAWLERRNAAVPVAQRMLPAAPLFKAVALGLKEVPELNGTFLDGAFHPSAAVHLGVAISLRQGGLVAPAIHDADKLGLDELMNALRDLIGRVRGGSIRSSELADPTVTVTNLGDQGVREVFGVIFPPQVAIVGLGRITQRPWVAEGRIEARPVVSATLSADHRVSDGHRGGRFLSAFERLLQEPEKL